MSSERVQANQQLQQVRELFNSLSPSRKVVAIAAGMGFIFSFLPWYGVSASFDGYANSWSENGWHDWGLLAALLFIAAGVWVVLPLAGVSLRGVLAALPPSVSEAKLVMSFGGVATLATIIFMLSEGRNISSPGISAGPSLGAYVGLICAVAIAIGGYLLRREPDVA